MMIWKELSQHIYLSILDSRLLLTKSDAFISKSENQQDEKIEKMMIMTTLFCNKTYNIKISRKIPCARVRLFHTFYKD